MIQLGEDLALLDDLDRPSRPTGLLGKLEHALLLELRMDDAEDLRLAAVRKTADDQIFADRGRRLRSSDVDRHHRRPGDRSRKTTTLARADRRRIPTIAVAPACRTDRARRPAR